MVGFRKYVVVLAVCAALPAAAAEPVKIGIVTTLSGPGGYLGEDVRDGFKLAVDEESGSLGGIPVALMVEDDALKPGNAKQITERFLTQSNAKIITGVIFSNVAEAIAPDVAQAGAFFISPNAGPTPFAGKACNKNYFTVSWANDSMNGAAGANATRLGYKRMFIMAPNYQAGKDALEGFKRYFKGGTIVGERYTSLDQTDFSAEIAQIRDVKPDAFFQFEPGGLGIALMKQYVQAGLKDSIPMVVAAPSMDARIVTAVGEAALGVNVSAQWNLDFDNPASKRFVADYEKAYNRPPTIYASQGYDTARLIGSALKAVSGDMSKTDAFRDAMAKADFVSVRGAFKFAANHFPVQDWYAMEVVKDQSGQLTTKTTAKILTDQVDPFVADCHM